MKNFAWIACLGMVCLLWPPAGQSAVDIETSSLKLRFNEQGKLVKASLCYPECGREDARLKDIEAPDGIIDFGQVDDPDWLLRRGNKAEQDASPDGPDEELQFVHASGQVVHWTIPARGYRIKALVTGGLGLTLRGGKSFTPRAAAGFGAWLEQVRYIATVPGGVVQAGIDEASEGQRVVEWAGFRDRFWAVLARGPAEAEAGFQASAGNHAAVVRLEPTSTVGEFVFFLGPMEPGELAAADPDLVDLVYGGLWFWLRWICLGLYFALGWIHAVIPEWGVAILLLSPVVSVLMLPLSRLADRLQQQVNTVEARLAPELFRIKREYSGEEQTAKLVALYQSEGVHPLYSLKSLLGVAIVIPVFIGAFDMLAGNIHLLHTGFLWVEDLSRPDALMQLPFSLPFFGSELNLLPFLMTGLSFGASWLHQPAGLDRRLRRQRIRNMILLALAFFALFYTFPAGMVLYWTSNNLISLARAYWARRSA